MKKIVIAAILFCILLSNAFASDDNQKLIEGANEDMLMLPKIIEKFYSDMDICNQEKTAERILMSSDIVKIY